MINAIQSQMRRRSDSQLQDTGGRRKRNKKSNMNMSPALDSETVGEKPVLRGRLLVEKNVFRFVHRNRSDSDENTSDKDMDDVNSAEHQTVPPTAQRLTQYRLKATKVSEKSPAPEQGMANNIVSAFV